MIKVEITDCMPNVLTNTVYSTLTRARDILLGLNRSHERDLSEWGFEVVISDVS